ncbi:MAG: hypothetical protein IID36_00310 [Planctomycetes bacterium]|nr:hypothetical protein [Planctomycetota bacterium]
MPDTLDIKVVYRASGRSRSVRPARAAKAPRPPTSGGSRGKRAGTIIALMNLAIAGGIFYVTWWQVDPDVTVTLEWQTPVIPVEALAQLGVFFGVRASDPADEPPAEDSDTASADETPVFEGATAAAVMGGASYTWLGAEMVAAGLLALSAGAGLGGLLTSRIRQGARIVAGVLLLYFFVHVAWVWMENRTGFPITAARDAWGILIALLLIFGAGIGRRGRGFGRVAGVAVILAGLASAAGLYLFTLCDASWHPETVIAGAASAMGLDASSLTFAVIIFVIHSLYGWVLLGLAANLGGPPGAAGVITAAAPSRGVTRVSTA